MTILLISGSRKATPAMLDYARRVVARAKELNWTIIVGDAEGVDAAVVEACHEFKVPYMCFGITTNPRRARPLASYYYRVYATRYPQRDQYMAEQCDRAIGIWNGQSPGTRITIQMVKALEKPTDMIVFEAHYEPTT